MVGRDGESPPARPAGEEDPITLISIDEHGTIREEPRGTNAATDHSCEHHTNPNARNLVVCIDGTANQFSLKVRARLRCLRE